MRGKDSKASAGHSSEKYARKTAEKETYRFSGTFRKERRSQTDSYDHNLSFFFKGIWRNKPEYLYW